jgi:uncharacterized membrane protein
MKRSSFGEKSILSDVYSQAADFGKGYTYVVAAFFFVICIIAILGGIALINRKARNIKVDFKITTVTPITKTELVPQGNTNIQQTRTVYNLTGTVKECPGKTLTLLEYGSFVVAGQSIEAWVDPSCNTNEVFASSDDTQGLGWIIIIVAIIGIIINVVRLFLVRRYKGIAALSGASGAANLFKVFK